MNQFDISNLPPEETIVTTRRLLTSLRGGEVVKLKTNQEKSMTDIPALCKLRGYTLMNAYSIENDIYYVIQKN